MGWLREDACRPSTVLDNSIVMEQKTLSGLDFWSCIRDLQQQKHPSSWQRATSLSPRSQCQDRCCFDAVSCDCALTLTTRCVFCGVGQLDLVKRTAELARVFGIDFYSVLSRGSQFRVESMMLRLAHTQNYLMLSPSKQQVVCRQALRLECDVVHLVSPRWAC